MRPQLFKMAGDLKEDEEGMATILQLNDSLIRVLDTYKQVMINGDTPPSTEAGAASATSSTVPLETSAPSATANSATATEQVNKSSVWRKI